MHKPLCLALLLAATAHALAADDATSKQTADFRQWQKRADAEQAAADSALTDLQQRAAAGDATAQFELGALYYLGQGVPQDYAQAAVWWERAATQDHVDAQFNLGALYGEGQGVAQDYSQARAWYEKAAAQGHARAQYNLGVLYNKGRGVVQDYAQARTWYEKAAVQGHAKAQFNLGALYENGQGITQDYDKARAWYEKVAAQTDDQEAQQAAQQVLQDLDKTGNNKP